MNFDFYLFGTPDGYDQYPLDDKEILFKSFRDSNCPIQLTIYRKAELVYFVYYRRLNLNSDAYFGMSVVFNGAYPSNLSNVFEVFNGLYLSIVSKGKMLRKDRKGMIGFGLSRFTAMPDEIESLERECKSFVEKQLSRSEKPLPTEYVVQDRLAAFAFDLEYLPTPLHDLLQHYNRIDLTKEKPGGQSKVSENSKVGHKKLLYFLIPTLLVVFVGFYYVFKLDEPTPEEPVQKENPSETIQPESFQLISGKRYSYEGELSENGLPDGDGKAVFDDGIYEGGFKDGNMCGYGELRYTKGDWEGRVYKGCFKNNVLDSGMLVSGSVVFKGHFKDMEYWEGVLVHNETDTIIVSNGSY